MNVRLGECVFGENIRLREYRIGECEVGRMWDLGNIGFGEYRVGECEVGRMCFFGRI